MEYHKNLFQYLDFGGFDKTLQYFDKEISSKGKPVASHEGKGPVSQKQLAAQVNPACIFLFNL